jgi:diaminopimelate epimerase
MHGCQNDYLFLNMFRSDLNSLPQWNLPELVRRLSNRQTGLGADGLIIVGPAREEGFHAAMAMYNADGSEGKMCGNGLRCAAKLVAESLPELKNQTIRFQTLAGPREVSLVSVESPERWIMRAQMGRPAFLPAKIPVLFDDVMVMNEDFEVLGRTLKISCVSMGNPHCVIEVEDLENFPVHEVGPAIEKHEVFPEGVNVEFVSYGDGFVRQRTWERGSGETQACGTGACAVGVYSIMGQKLKSPITVKLKGGDLQVEWDGLREVYLTGEAVTVEEGTFDPHQWGAS